MASVELYPATAALALLLGGHGYRKGSLSWSGAVAASLLGYLCLANPQRLFGVSMLALYFVGSRATKYRASTKSKLEDGHDGHGASGQRDAFQVACNAWLGVVCSALWRHTYAHSSSSSGCGIYAIDNQALFTSLQFIRTGVAFFAACLGDTLASELGILSRSQPRLATTLRKVPNGTNGGISAWGTLCSLVGGLIVGVLAMITLRLNEPSCRWQLSLLALGGTAGLLGSAIDSILGATLKQTRYSKARGKVLTDHGQSLRRNDGDIIVISGWPLLSNNQVNLLSSSSTALLLGLLTR